MSKTSIHLRAAIAALAQLKGANPTVTVHNSDELVDLVAEYPDAERHVSHTEAYGDLRRYDVAHATVYGVGVTAFGLHRAVKIVEVEA